jgi:Flp pilus assembly protein TadG
MIGVAMSVDKRRRRKGAAAVEFALVLLPIWTIVMGIIECGRLMSAETILVNAAREGARLAAMSGSTMGSSTSTGASEVNYRVRQFLDSAAIPSGAATITTSDLDQPGISDLNYASAGDRIQVAVSIPFSSVAWSTPWFFGRSTLSVSSIMRKEAP